MKAITLIQPWATLIAIGAKRIETRSWQTAYRGRLAIHAGLSTRFIDPKAPEYICTEEPFYSVLMNAIKFSDQEFMPLGCVIATCELVACTQLGACVSIQNVPTLVRGVCVPPAEQDPELAFGDYTPGRFAWILEDIEPLPKPVPARGSLGLWDWVPPQNLFNVNRNRQPLIANR